MSGGPDGHREHGLLEGGGLLAQEAQFATGLHEAREALVGAKAVDATLRVGYGILVAQCLRAGLVAQAAVFDELRFAVFATIPGDALLIQLRNVGGEFLARGQNVGVGFLLKAQAFLLGIRLCLEFLLGFSREEGVCVPAPVLLFDVLGGARQVALLCRIERGLVAAIVFGDLA